jgi:hypothetical protein
VTVVLEAGWFPGRKKVFRELTYVLHAKCLWKDCEVSELLLKRSVLGMHTLSSTEACFFLGASAFLGGMLAVVDGHAGQAFGGIKM